MICIVKLYKQCPLNFIKIKKKKYIGNIEILKMCLKQPQPHIPWILKGEPEFSQECQTLALTAQCDRKMAVVASHGAAALRSRHQWLVQLPSHNHIWQQLPCHHSTRDRRVWKTVRRDTSLGLSKNRLIYCCRCKEQQHECWTPCMS